MTNKEAKEKIFDATQLLMEIYKELAERTTAPKLTVIEFKGGKANEGKPEEARHE